MKIVVMRTHEGVKPGAGKHVPQLLAEQAKVNQQLHDEGIVESVISLSEVTGPGGAIIRIMEQDRLNDFLFHPDFVALRGKAEMTLENVRMTLYVMPEELPAGVMEQWLEQAAAYA